MTEKEVQAGHNDSELRRKKRRRFIIFIIFFIVGNVVINTIMAVTLLKARNPKFRIQEAFITNINGGAPAILHLEFSLKNTNFGKYKYPRATVVIMRDGVEVGAGDLPKSKVGWRSTKTFSLDVVLNPGNDDFNSPMYRITAQAKLTGKAKIMFIMKKRKGADLDCAMDVVRATQQIVNIACS